MPRPDLYRPYLQIEVEGKTPIRIITSPDREQTEGRFFNILYPDITQERRWDWGNAMEIIGLTEEEVLERFTTALRGLPSYPRQADRSRKMVQG